MRVVVQRVTRAHVEIEGSIYSQIGQGLCVFLGIERNAKRDDLSWLVNKIIQLRIFSDEEGKMNRSLLDIDGDILLISQFTLHASTKKGNRPSFIDAETPDSAQEIYNAFIIEIEKKLGKPVCTGVFGADMKVSLVNDGPVTIIIDTEYKW
ncbi:MAG TPA: D-aminoacyl-tRNA deacylase [Membranihabitans sp.]|nr:D-aminoacyl-tRNA deacylase [Membranihabitans sp.]